MSLFDNERGIRVAPSQRDPYAVYVMVYHQTLTVEEALELAREINRVAFHQKELRDKGYEGATRCCARCKHLLEAHEETAPGGTLLTRCTIKGCNCES